MMDFNAGAVYHFHSSSCFVGFECIQPHGRLVVLLSLLVYHPLKPQWQVGVFLWYFVNIKKETTKASW